MSDDSGVDDDTPADDAAGLEDEESRIDRTRTDYTGAVLDEDFQPVDEVELAEEGMLLDDPERLSRGQGGVAGLDPDDVGWDLDEEVGGES